MEASGLKLCTWQFYVDHAKNLAEIGEKPPKSCYFVPLSTPRCCNIGGLYLYHLKALGLKLCPTKFQVDRAKNLAEIGEKPKTKFLNFLKFFLKG